MKKKLTFIFILITVSMLGIILFQVNFIVKTYFEKVRSITFGTEWALTEAVQKYRYENISLIRKQLSPLFSNLYDDTEIKTSRDSLIIILKEKADSVRTTSLSFTRGRVKVLLPSRKIIGNEMGYESIDMKAKSIIDSLFPQLKNNCIPVYFKEDTAKISNYFKSALARHNSDFNKIKLVFSCSNNMPFNDVVMFSSGSRLYSYQSSYLSDYGTYKNRTVAVDIQSTSNLAFPHIINLIILSAVLIIIAIGSFIYLFLIILKQKRLAEMKDDFINNMTHELKTPIAIISAAVEGMQSFNALENKEKTSRYLETSRKELNRLNELVTKVLHMASYEKKDIQLSISKIDVDELINDVIDTFKNHTDKTLDITFNNISSIKYLNVDPVHFRNVISNLIDNAIKYSGIKAEVAINCSAYEKLIKFSIIDKGIGIPASQLNHIFEKFHRVPTGNIHNVKGTGLGLSYVKYIVEIHGGTITVKSELNKGSEFIISLPYNA